MYKCVADFQQDRLWCYGLSCQKSLSTINKYDDEVLTNAVEGLGILGALVAETFHWQIQYPGQTSEDIGKG